MHLTRARSRNLWNSHNWTQITHILRVSLSPDASCSFAWETRKKGEGSGQSAISENPDTNQSAAPSHSWESQRVLKQMNFWRCFKSGVPHLILEKRTCCNFSLKLKRIVGEVEESDKLEFLGLPFQHSTKVDDTMIKRKPFLVRTN